MKKVVLTFGLISGSIMAVLMWLTIPLISHREGFDGGELLGYSSMLVAFLMIFFGIRTYRQNNDNVVSFGRAFSVGILISLISCVMYVASWEVMNYTIMPDFAHKYSEQMIKKAQKEGKSAAQVAAIAKEMAEFEENYKNPLFNVGMTFLECFPVGLVVTLISAAILRKKSGEPPQTAAAATA